MAFKIADLYTDLSIKGYGTTARQMEQFKKQLQQTNATAEKMGKTLQSAFAIGGAAMVAASTRQFVGMMGSMEAGFTEIRKTTNLTDADFESLTRRINEMAVNLRVPLADIQKIAATAGQLGIDKADEIAAFTKEIAKLVNTSTLGAESAAGMSAVIMRQFELPINKVENFASVLTKMAAVSVASEEDILEVTRRIMGTAKTIGLSVDQAMALAAALKDVGVSSEVGGTVITNLFTKMIAGGEDVAAAMGMAQEEYDKLLSTDPSGLVSRLLKTASTLDSKGKIGLLQGIDMDQGKAAATMLQLVNASDKFNEHMKSAAEEFKNPVALAKEFNVQLDDINKSLTAVGNKLQTMAGDERYGLNRFIRGNLGIVNAAMDYAMGDTANVDGVNVPKSNRHYQEMLSEVEKGKKLEAQGREVLARIMSQAKEDKSATENTADEINARIEAVIAEAKASENKLAAARIQAMKEGTQQVVRNALFDIQQSKPMMEGWIANVQKNMEAWGKKNQARRDAANDFAQQVADQFMGQMPQEFKPQFQGIDELHKQIQLAAVAPKKKGIEEIAADMLEQMKEEKMVLEEVKKLIAEGNIILPAV